MNLIFFHSNYFQFKQCNQRAYEKHTQSCNRRAIDGQEKLIDAYALDVLRLLCGEYTEESDICDKIINKTPKSKLKENDIPKSPINPFIAILNSIKE